MVNFLDQILQTLISLPNFHEIGSALVFFISLLPFFPVPAEGIIVPLLALAEPQEVEYMKTHLILYMILGEMISHSIVFYVVKHHITKWIKRLGVSDQTIEKNHVSYGKYALLILPSVIILPFLTDLTVAYLAHKKQRFEVVAILFVAGEVIRGFLYIYGVFSFFV